MQYRRLGRSGLEVSTLCLGTMTFGEVDASSFMYKVGCSEEEARRILDRSVEAGVNFLDTADVYGNDSLIENVVGRWLKDHGRRDELVVATKCRFRMRPGPNGSGASRRHIVWSVEGSLKRLNVDYIDLYQIHMQDLKTPEDETLRALDDLVRQGKVRYIGGSNYAAYRMMESLALARQMGTERFVSMQMQYSLLVRDIEREHVPACVQNGVGILSWGPLAAGLLTGKVQRGETAPEGTRSARMGSTLQGHDTPRTWAILDALKEVAGARGVSQPAVALAWAAQRPGVASVIFGARSMGQLESNLQAADLVPDSSEMEKLTQASAFPLGYPYDFMKRVDGAW